MQPPENRTVETWARRICLAVAALSLAYTLAGAARLARSDITDWRMAIETNVVYALMKVLDGRSLYSPPDEPPFDVIQYGPPYFRLVAALCHAVGADDPAEVMKVARWVSLACLTLTGLAYYAILAGVLRLSASLSFLATALILAQGASLTALARPDALSFLLAAAGLGLVLWAVRPREGGRPEAAALIVAALCLALAAYAKQDRAVLGGLLVLGLLAGRDLRSAAILLVGMALAGVGLLGMEWARYGPTLKAHLLDGVRNGFSFRFAFITAYQPFFSGWSWLVGAAAASAVVMWPDGRDRRVRLLIALVAGYLAYGVLGASKIGAGSKYFYEFQVYAIMLVAWALDRAAGRRHEDAPAVAGGRGATPSAWVVVLASVTYIGFLPVLAIMNYRDYGSMPTYEARRPVAAYLNGLLERDPESYAIVEYTNEDALAQFLGDRVLAPTSSLADLAHRNGLVDYERFREMVREGQVRYYVRTEGYPSKGDVFLGMDLPPTRPLRSFDGFTVHEFLTGPADGAGPP